jgi:PTS system nitrogen regulatory IIA component
MTESVAMRDLLSSNAVLAPLEASSKKELLEELSRHAAKVLHLPEHIVFDVLWERERLGTTGVGAGIAIPHGRVSGLEDVHGFFARLATPVPFESADGRSVDLVFLLLSPEGAAADHLHALAAVSRLMRDPQFSEQLRKAKDAQSLNRLLKTAPAAKAA